MDKGVLCIAAAQTIVWAGLYYIFPALLPRWEMALGWSKVQLTGAFTVSVVASALLAPAVGRIIDRGMARLLMTLSSVAGAVLLLLMSQVEELWQFYLCWILMGVALAGCLYESCFSLVTRARGAQARRAIVQISLIAGFAGSFSFPLAHLLGESYGWRVTLQLFAVAIIAAGVPLMWLGAGYIEATATEKPLPAHVAKTRGSTVLLSPLLLMLAIAFAMLAIVHGAALHHLLPLLQERGVEAGFAVLLASFIGPMQVAGRLAMMAMERLVSTRHVTGSCFVVMALAILVLIVAADDTIRLAAFVLLFGSGYGIVSIVRPVITREILGQQDFGEKSGTVALFYLSGAALAPWLGAMLWVFGGYQLMLWVLAFMACAGLAFYRSAQSMADRAAGSKL